MRTVMIALMLGTMACDSQRLREDWTAWYDPGSDLDVQEPIAFTDQPYTFTGPTALADLPRPETWATWFAETDPPATVCADWQTIDGLPVEVTGVVTLHPRQYIKVSGCRPEGDIVVDSDEKYYGSYFIQDGSDGFFVLGDSKVARFDMGDRVSLRVRAVKDVDGFPMISAHDVTEVVRGPEPIAYQTVTGRSLGEVDVSKVVRVEGIVGGPMGQFGEIYLCTGPDPDLTTQNIGGDLIPRCFTGGGDEAPAYLISVDVELQRRGVTLPVGDRFAITGPVMLSFDQYQVNVMRVGQMERLAD